LRYADRDERRNRAGSPLNKEILRSSHALAVDQNQREPRSGLPEGSVTKSQFLPVGRLAEAMAAASLDVGSQ
jgi:hypothetical protein